MITVPIADLKSFLNHSKNIKTNGILPILSCIKIECKGNGATIAKTNLNAFVVCNIGADFKKPETFIIEEQALATCVNFSNSEEVKISASGNIITIDDGNKVVKTQVPGENFPSIEMASDKDKTVFDEDVISAMTIANKHTLVSNDRGLRDWKSFVNIVQMKKKSWVLGANGPISYFKSFKQKLPTVSLEVDVVSVLSKFPELEYYSSERYDYFHYLGLTYGFIKSEIKSPELETVIDKFKSEDSFVINRKDILDFCESTIFLNKSALPPEVSIKDHADGLQLTFESGSGANGQSQIIEAEKTFDVPEILFQPKNMIIALSGLSGVEKIKISKIFGNMVIETEDDKDYIGSVMELARLVNA